jgi:hypothetical protein
MKTKNKTWIVTVKDEAGGRIIDSWEVHASDDTSAWKKTSSMLKKRIKWSVYQWEMERIK